MATTLLAEACDRQRERTREIAAHSAPRPGSTQHALTMRAANQQIDLLERAGQFRSSAGKANATDRTPVALDTVANTM